MVNITISYDGVVTGDKGKIIGYEGQEYSEVINIVHPTFSGTKDYIEYKYGNTIFRNEIDSSGQVSIKIGTSGYVKCQYLAIDISTGEIKFKSDYWNCIIKKGLKIQPSHFPCNAIGHRYHDRRPQVVAGYYYDDACGCIHGNPDSFNAYEAYSKLYDMIENESDIRTNLLDDVNKDIAKIKEVLHINETIASKIDPNTLMIDGTYKVEYNEEYESNLPDSNSRNGYTIVVMSFGEDYILQNAKEDNTTNLYTRTLEDKLMQTWTEWTLVTTNQN